MPDYPCTTAAGPVYATVEIPGSKSITNRALIAAALADGTSILSNALFADDTRHMLEALRTLGIAITIDEPEHRIEVSGCKGNPPEGEARLYCGNSGTTIRFCTAMAALIDGRIELDGTARMRERPIDDLVTALQSYGTRVEYLEAAGFPPIAVRGGGLSGGHLRFDSPPSSQFVSAMLLVTPYAHQDALIEITGDILSRPYLRMTTAVMESFGVSMIEQYDEASAQFIVAVPQRYQPAHFTVEPDASNASYFLAGAAITGGSVTVAGLSSSIQGDARFADVLGQMGCRVARSGEGITVEGPARGGQLQGIDINLRDMPDMVQTLAVVALFAQGRTTIRDVANLRIKETDRLAALRTELSKLGATVTESADGITIDPPSTPREAAIETYDDHRMAMSFAVAGLRIPGVVIRDAQCCAKTFPDFFERFEALRASATPPA